MSVRPQLCDHQSRIRDGVQEDVRRPFGMEDGSGSSELNVVSEGEVVEDVRTTSLPHSQTFDLFLQLRRGRTM